MLSYGASAAPEPGPGQVLVKLEAIGINFIDVYRRVGLYPVPLPFIPGEESGGRRRSDRPGRRYCALWVNTLLLRMCWAHMPNMLWCRPSGWC